MLRALGNVGGWEHRSPQGQRPRQPSEPELDTSDQAALEILSAQRASSPPERGETVFSPFPRARVSCRELGLIYRVP